MKKSVFVIYTLFCLTLGGLLFHGISIAGGYFSTKYYAMYELGAPAGYRACAGVSFKDGVTRNDVLIDWKSNKNFVIFIKE